MFLIRDNDDVVYSFGTLNLDSNLSPDQTLCETRANQFVKKYFGLPENARLANRGAFLARNVALSDDQTEQEKVVSYAIEYEQVFNDLPISTLNGGNSIFVSLGNNGIDHAHMKWDDFVATDKYNKIIPETEAIQLVANALATQDVYESLYSSINQVKMNTKLVYSNAFSAYSSDYIPVWETTIIDDGRVILVNAVTGGIIMLRRLYYCLVLAVTFFCVFAFTGCHTDSKDLIENSTKPYQSPISTANDNTTDNTVDNNTTVIPVTDTPNITGPIDQFERDIFNKRGFEVPFDYASRSNALAAQMVVTSQTDPAINGRDVKRFIKDYKNGTDCTLIVVQYDGNALARIALLLYQGGILRCETIIGDARTQYLFNDIISEGYDVYGTGEGGEKVLLAVNVREIKDEEPVPADLTGKLDWFPEAIGVEVRYILSPALSDTARSEEKKLTTAQKKEMIKLLLAGPVYLFNVDLYQAPNHDLVISAEYDTHYASFHVLSDGSIWVGVDHVQYISTSKALYDYIIGLTTIDAYDAKMLGDVTSITVRYKDDEGTIKKISIDDRDTVDGVAKALTLADASMFKISFVNPPDLEITLHTKAKDIVCTVFGEKQLGHPEDAGEFTINGFYWYSSPEAVDLIRSLLK